jgi:hypothetical protein
MDNNKLDSLENTTVVASSIVIAIIGLGYCVNTQYYPNLYHFGFENVSGNNVFRAIGTMYISLSIFWLSSIFQPAWKMGALLSIAFFMGGLCFGRLISLIVDGSPHQLVWAFLVGELFTCLQALFIYKKKYSSN